MVRPIAPVTNDNDVQDSQKLGGMVPRTYPYWARLLHWCTVRPTTVRLSLLGSYGHIGPGVRCKRLMAACLPVHI
eukprot:6451456-Pyramimonas_sp.AAC.1